MTIPFNIPAATDAVVAFDDVFLPIGASALEMVVGDIEAHAAVIAPAPTAFFAGRGRHATGYSSLLRFIYELTALFQIRGWGFQAFVGHV